MKKIIFLISILFCFSRAEAQNSDNKPVAVLYIIKSKTGITKTNHLFVDAEDISQLYIPSRDEASKSFGPIKEDVVMYITLKQGVKLLTLSGLLANRKLAEDFHNIPVYIDGETVSNPDDILSTETGLRDLKRTSRRIEIITKLWPRPKNLTGLRH